MIFEKQKPTTIKDVANRLGVSAQSVSLAVNGTGRLSPAVRAKILETAREMNYTPNVAARSLTSRQSYLLGVVVPYVSRSFFGHIIAGIEEVAQEGNFAVLVGNSEGGCEVEKRAIHLMRLHKVDGVITLPDPALLDVYREIDESGVPVVQIMHRLPALNRHCISIDNRLGAELAVKHLLRQGHRNIGLLAHGSAIATAAQRIAGFRETMAAAGIPEPWPHCDCELDPSAAELAAARMFSEHPAMTALFCTSDYAALGAMRAARKSGRRIPEDLALIGFDDMDFASMQSEKQISSVTQPKEEVGRRAAAMLLALLRREPVTEQLLAPTLVLRDTTEQKPKEDC